MNTQKLVRDRIPHMPHKDPCLHMEFRKTKSVGEYIHFLLQKRIEEKHEFLSAIRNGDSLEEAGDVLEVLDTLIDVFGRQNRWSEREIYIYEREQFIEYLQEKYRFTIESILYIQGKKRSRKGGFSKGWIWVK